MFPFDCFLFMPRLGPGIHALPPSYKKDVDGRVVKFTAGQRGALTRWPGHDE